MVGGGGGNGEFNSGGGGNGEFNSGGGGNGEFDSGGVNRDSLFDGVNFNYVNSRELPVLELEELEEEDDLNHLPAPTMAELEANYQSSMMRDILSLCKSTDQRQAIYQDQINSNTTRLNVQEAVNDNVNSRLNAQRAEIEQLRRLVAQQRNIPAPSSGSTSAPASASTIQVIKLLVECGDTLCGFQGDVVMIDVELLIKLHSHITRKSQRSVRDMVTNALSPYMPGALVAVPEGMISTSRRCIGVTISFTNMLSIFELYFSVSHTTMHKLDSILHVQRKACKIIRDLRTLLIAGDALPNMQSHLDPAAMQSFHQAFETKLLRIVDPPDSHTMYALARSTPSRRSQRV